MCSHPEHRYEVLPDGQIDEKHVISHEELAEFRKRFAGLPSRIQAEFFGYMASGREVPNGKSWTDAEGQ